MQQEQQEGETGTTAEEVAPVKETKSVSSWTSFLKLGMLHILTGYDHLLFLLALLVWKQSFKQYAAIVTSFTIAHSITISLAVLGIVDLPSRFVEAVIAFSICYVAAENLFRKEIRHRWGLTFLFGLIHGLGFAEHLERNEYLEITSSLSAIQLQYWNRTCPISDRHFDPACSFIYTSPRLLE